MTQQSQARWRLDGFNRLVLAGALANALVVLSLLVYAGSR